MFELDETSDAASPARAGTHASPEDTRRPRTFLDPVMQALVQDAWLLGDGSGAGVLLALAAEIADFGLGDDERAEVLHQRAAAHRDADRRAFAGLRRIQRSRGDAAAVLELWEREYESAPDDAGRVAASIGLARHALRAGLPPERARALLEESRVLLPYVPPGLAALWSASLEDVCVLTGAHEDALAARAARVEALSELGTLVAEACEDRVALSMVALCEALDADEEELVRWIGRAHEAAPSEQTLLALVRRCMDSADWNAAEALLSEGVHACDSDARGRVLLLLGQIRAWHLGDRSGALQALREGLRSNGHAPLIAPTFLGIAREAHNEVILEEFGDALAARLEFAATAAERADLLVRMAQLYAAREDLLPHAIELAQEALAQCPLYGPACRLEEELLERSGQWDVLVRVLEARLPHVEHEGDRQLLHERIAEICLERLANPGEAETHLRAALDCGVALRPVRRLARLLESRGAWPELVEHLCLAADSVSSPQARAELLHRAARLTEERIGDREEVVALLVGLLEVAPRFNSTLSELDRLLEDTESWDLRLELCEKSLEALVDDNEARSDVYLRAAEICAHGIGDDARSEEWLRRALVENPANLSASSMLGELLGRQRRWDDLARLEAQVGRAHLEPARKLASLQRLGELLATRANDLERAITCFEQLIEADSRFADQALVWLERIHEARGDADAVLDVLRRRRRLVPDPQMDARLAFRIAENLEFRQGREVEAFDAWVDALADPLAAEIALDAIDRLWQRPSIPTDARERAVGSVHQLASRESPALRRRAQTLLCDRLLPRNTDALIELRTTLAQEWPHDVRVGEYCALMALRGGDARAAASWRATRDIAPVETAASALDAIDDGLEPALEPDTSTPAELRALLALERGSMDGPFAGVQERELLSLIRSESVSVGDLLVAEGSELRLRLAVCAARALGDPDNLIAAWHQLIDSCEVEILRLRALLDMARDPDVNGEEAVRRLVEAEGLCPHGHAMREELYEILGVRGAWEALARALGNHVDGGALPPEEGAQLALRRARALLRCRRDEDALEALRYGVVCAPGNAEIAMEKARLEAQRDQLSDARETIESCLDAGVPDDARLALLARLADLHEREGGVAARMIECLEDAHAIAGGEARWAIRLARAHGASGNARRAMTLYRESLRTPPVADEIHHWLDLASIADRRARQPDKAEEILWSLLVRFPERQEVLSELESFFRRHRQAHAFANQLRSLLEDGLPEVADRRRGELWLYLGELEASVLHHYALAEDALQRAARALPERQDITLRRARVIAAQPGRHGDAYRFLRRLIASVDDPTLSGEAAEILAGVAAERGDRERASLAGDVAAVLQGRGAVAPPHLKRDPDGRPGLTRVLRLAAPERADLKALTVLRAVAPLGERVLSEGLPSRRELRASRVRTEEYPEVIRYTELAATCLQVPLPRVFVSEVASAVQVPELESIVLPWRLVEEGDDLALRFACGWGVMASALGFAALIHSADDDMQHLLRAVAARGLHRDEWATGVHYERTGGLLNANARRGAITALQEYEAILDTPGPHLMTPWRSLADRMGLLCCGDLATAAHQIEHMCRTSDERTRRLQPLLAWSLGDRYAQLRHEAGLAPAPIQPAEDTSPNPTH